MALPCGFYLGSARRGRTHARRHVLDWGRGENRRAERGVGLGDETGWASLPPSMSPFLDAADKLDQGGSRAITLLGLRKL